MDAETFFILFAAAGVLGIIVLAESVWAATHHHRR
jgi:hypothetical protein